MESLAVLSTAVIALANTSRYLYESDYVGGGPDGAVASIVMLGLLVWLYWLFWDR